MARELAGRLRVHRDRADDVSVSPGDGDGQQRLELLLLELGDELVARIVDGVLGEGGLAVLDCPPRDALAVIQADLPDELAVGLRCRPQHEAVVLDQVDEAGVNGARVRQQAHDGAQHLAEVEGGADSRNDLVQDPLARLRRSPALCHAGHRTPVEPRGRGMCVRRCFFTLPRAPAKRAWAVEPG